MLLHSTTGGWLGVGKLNTMTWNVHEFVLAEESIAVQVTVLVPSANALPDAGVQLVVRPPQLSLAVGAPKNTFTCDWPNRMFVTTSPAHEMLGNVWSRTVIVAWQELVAPLSSVTVSVTVVMPVAYGPAGLSVMLVIVPSESDEPLSTALTKTFWMQKAFAFVVTSLQRAVGG